MATFGERLKYLRESTNMSQADFADIISVNRMTINNYETGKRYPDIKFAMDVADYFDVTLDYLCGKSEYRRPETYKVGMEKAEEFVGLIGNSFEKEAQTLLNELIYILKLAGDDNITTEVLSEINAILKALQEVIRAYRQSKKNMDRNELTEQEKEIPYYMDLYALSQCEPVAVQNSLAKTEISKVLDDTYGKLKIKLTGIK